MRSPPAPLRGGSDRARRRERRSLDAWTLALLPACASGAAAVHARRRAVRLLISPAVEPHVGARVAVCLATAGPLLAVAWAIRRYRPDPRWAQPGAAAIVAAALGCLVALTRLGAGGGHELLVVLAMASGFVFLSGGWFGAALVAIVAVYNLAMPVEPGVAERLRGDLSLFGAAVAAAVIQRARLRIGRSYARLRRADRRHRRLLAGALDEAHRALARRRRAERALRRVDRERDELLAAIGHELRNALAPIDHAGALLARPGVDDHERGWAVRTIRRQAGLLGRLIDDLNDAARIARGTLSLERRPVDLGALIDAAVDAARPFLDESRQALIVRKADRPMRVEADAGRIEQVLINLLSNACRYSDPDRTIRLVATAGDREHVVEVRDEGIGIEPELLPRIFELFVRGPAARDRAPAGLGVGLRLARLLAELHGGALEARSEGPGLGSTFTLRLPALTAEPAPGPPAGAAGPSPARLLLVDDNRPMAEALARLLRHGGHQVRTACSGVEALEEVARDRPDLVLLDLALPDLDGFEVARRLRIASGPEPIPILALSGTAGDSERDRLRTVGVRGLLRKPVRAEQLREALADALAHPPAGPG